MACCLHLSSWHCLVMRIPDGTLKSLFDISLDQALLSLCYRTHWPLRPGHFCIDPLSLLVHVHSLFQVCSFSLLSPAFVIVFNTSVRFADMSGKLSLLGNAADLRRTVPLLDMKGATALITGPPQGQQMMITGGTLAPHDMPLLPDQQWP
jgi:hypothetical protein